MPRFVADFLDQLDEEIADARRDLALRVDRTEALVALRSRALDVSIKLQRPISLEDVESAATDEMDRAALAALFSRILALDPGGKPAFEDGQGATYPLETGAGP